VNTSHDLDFFQVQVVGGSRIQAEKMSCRELSEEKLDVEISAITADFCKTGILPYINVIAVSSANRAQTPKTGKEINPFQSDSDCAIARSVSSAHITPNDDCKISIRRPRSGSQSSDSQHVIAPSTQVSAITGDPRPTQPGTGSMTLRNLASSCRRRFSVLASALGGMPEERVAQCRMRYLEGTALELGDVIGAGGACEVLRATYRGQSVAVKRLLGYGADENDERDLQNLVKEIGCMCADLVHPNIVGFLGIVPDADSPLMVISDLSPFSLQHLLLPPP
jgi:hypothetical protein